MRTTLKYPSTIASLAAALSIMSCAPDSPPTAPVPVETRSAQQKLQDLQNKYGWVGQYHTDGLAYVYTQLAKGKGKPRTKADLCRTIAKATKDFHKAARHTDIPAGLIDPSMMDGTCPADDATRNVRSSVTSLPMSQARVRSELSGAATDYIDQIAVLAGSATSRQALLNGVNSIESQAASLPTEEAGAVVAVGSVAVSSAYYWEANLNSWLDLSGVPLPTYSVSAHDLTASTVASVASSTTGRRFSIPWWRNPFVMGFQRVLVSDALAAARVLYAAWEAGPIVLDAAAAAALWASSLAAITSIFF